MEKKDALKLFFSLAVSALLILVLIMNASVSRIFLALNSIPVSVLGLCFLFYVISYSLRTIRFKIQLKEEISFARLFSIVGISSFLVGMLPMRAGELSYVYLAGKEKERKTRALASLLVARFFDFSAVLSFFIMMALLSGAEGKPMLIGAAGGALMLATPVLFIFFSGRMLAWARKTSFGKKKKASYLIGKAQETIYFLKGMGRLKIAAIYALSLLIWASNYYLSFLLVRAMGIGIDIRLIIMAFGFSAIFSMIPISGFMGFGTQETGWTIGFMFFGVEKGLAISSGFAFHLVNIFYLIIFGSAGIIIYFLSGNALTPLFRKDK